MRGMWAVQGYVLMTTVLVLRARDALPLPGARFVSSAGFQVEVHRFQTARKELSWIQKKTVAGDVPSESSCTSTTAATKSGTSSLKSKKKKSGTVSKKIAVATATPIGKLTDKYAAAPSGGAVHGDGPVQSHGAVRSAGAVHGDGAVGWCGPW